MDNNNVCVGIEIKSVGKPVEVSSKYCYYTAYVADVTVVFEDREYVISYAFGHSTIGFYDDVTWYDLKRDKELYYYGDDSTEDDAMTASQFRQACEMYEESWMDYEIESLQEQLDDSGINTLEDLYAVFDKSIDDNRIANWYKSDRCFEAVDPTLDQDIEVSGDWYNPVSVTDDTISFNVWVRHAGEYDFNVGKKHVVMTFNRADIDANFNFADECYTKFIREY